MVSTPLLWTNRSAGTSSRPPSRSATTLSAVTSTVSLWKTPLSSTGSCCRPVLVVPSATSLPRASTPSKWASDDHFQLIGANSFAIFRTRSLRLSSRVRRRNSLSFKCGLSGRPVPSRRSLLATSPCSPASVCWTPFSRESRRILCFAFPLTIRSLAVCKVEPLLSPALSAAARP